MKKEHDAEFIKKVLTRVAEILEGEEDHRGWVDKVGAEFKISRQQVDGFMRRFGTADQVDRLLEGSPEGKPKMQIAGGGSRTALIEAPERRSVASRVFAHCVKVADSGPIPRPEIEPTTELPARNWKQLHEVIVELVMENRRLKGLAA